MSVNKVVFYSLILIGALLNLGMNFDLDAQILEWRGLKIVTSFVAGGALSLAGLCLQTWFRNYLAGPFVLGINSGASLFIAFAIFGTGLFGIDLGGHGYMVAGILGATLSLLGLSFVSFLLSEQIYLIIYGLIFSYFSSGIVNVLMRDADQFQVRSYLVYHLGSFERTSGMEVFVMIGFVLSVFIYLLKNFKILNYSYLGERYARSCGVDLKRFQTKILIAVGILIGVVNVFCGPLVFVGLMGPHLARAVIKSNNHRELIPFSVLSGGIICLYSQWVVSAFFADSIPLNGILGLVGAPVIGVLILKKIRLQKRRYV